MATEGFAGVRLPRSPVYGTRGMVVSGHSLASLAGLRALEAGGTVADAAIATSAVLTVVLPHATSFGGDAFILHHDAKTGTTEGLNASGPAPEGAVPEQFPDGMITRGPMAVSVPGIARGWEELHLRHGRLPWPDLFAEAIRLAMDGHPLARILGAALHLYRANVERDPGLSALYLPEGEPLVAGDVLCQPKLARSLRALAQDGSAAYYEGPIAESIGAYSEANGGLLSDRDFAGYAPEWVEPLATTFRGLTVKVMPPNSFGILLLMQLNVLDGLSQDELAGDDSRRLAAIMSAMRGSFAEGRHHIADPRISPAPVDDLLGPAMTRKLRDAVRVGLTPPVTADRGGTSCIVIADREGNGISVVQSVFHVFGSAFLDPGTGILLNNRMTGFTTEVGHANVVAPGKRPAHTLNPVQVFDQGRLKYLLATPGGPSQTLSHVQMLISMLDRGMELSEAVEAPRLSINLAGTALIEDGFPDSVAAGLAAFGHPTERASGASYFGSMKAIEILSNGVLCGAADARREAYATGS